LVTFKRLSRKKSIFLFGACSESAGDFFEVSKQLNLSPVFVDNLDLGLKLSRFPVIHFRQIRNVDFQCQTAIAIVTPASRVSAKTHAVSLGFTNFPPLVSNSADVSSSAHIEQGVFINASSIVGESAFLEKFTIVNKGANIAHDVFIGEFSHIAPSACILGSVQIGKRCVIGANSTILPKLKIGDESIIGAGAVVTRDVPANVKVVGVPARIVGEIK